MKSSKKVILLLSLLIISVGIIIFFSDHLGIIFPLSIVDKTNIFLTVVIALFALMEGYSNYLQVELSQNRNLIDDTRDELEKAYGPLYTLLDRESPGYGNLLYPYPEKEQLDKIMTTYPFVFPKDLYEFWKEKIHNIEDENVRDPATMTRCVEDLDKFRIMLNEEYGNKVESYNKLLRKL